MSCLFNFSGLERKHPDVSGGEDVYAYLLECEGKKGAICSPSGETPVKQNMAELGRETNRRL